MAIYIDDRDSLPIIAAAQAWVASCLIEDGSMLGRDHLWTSENIQSLDHHFVHSLDAGSGTFFEKLHTQLESSPAPSKRLMAEILWALFLFPTNIGIETKRISITKVPVGRQAQLRPTHLK